MTASTSMSRRTQGFTLIELMVVVALVAILAAVAVPSFRDLLLNQRLAASTSDFVAALSTARGEAMKHSQSVTLTPVSVGGGWAGGWTVQTKEGSSTKTLRTFEALREGVAVDTSLGNGFKNSVTYDANGFAGNSSGFIALGCLTLKAATGRRSSIVLPASGRPKVCNPDVSGDCGSGTCGSAS